MKLNSQYYLRVSGAIPPLPVFLHVVQSSKFSIHSCMASPYTSDGQYHKFIFLVPISSNKSRTKDRIVLNYLHPSPFTLLVRGLTFGCVCYTNTNYSTLQSTKRKDLLFTCITKWWLACVLQLNNSETPP
jgi:hypothetical protein